MDRWGRVSALVSGLDCNAGGVGLDCSEWEGELEDPLTGMARVYYWRGQCQCSRDGKILSSSIRGRVFIGVEWGE